MARWLDIFTASDLANALHTTPEVARRALVALEAHKLVIDTGSTLDGQDGSETVWEMHPLPDGIVNRIKRTPPERLVGYDLAPVRGMPVRLVDHGDRGTAMSTPGARKQLKDRERAYQRHMEAISNRRKKDIARRRSKAEHRRVSISEIKN